MRPLNRSGEVASRTESLHAESGAFSISVDGSSVDNADLVIISVIILRIGVAQDADKSSVRVAAGAMVKTAAAEAATHVAASTRNADRIMMISTVVLAGGGSVAAPLPLARVRKESPRVILSAATASGCHAEGAARQSI